MAATNYQIEKAEAVYLLAALKGEAPAFDLPADVANSLLMELLKLAKSLADNSREWLEMAAVIHGDIHPYQAEKLNAPTLEGALSHLAMLPAVDCKKACPTCAFRNGSPANQVEATADDILMCLDTGEDFMCHWNNDVPSATKRVCAGFAALRESKMNESNAD
jgi:hypothetical protein